MVWMFIQSSSFYGSSGSSGLASFLRTAFTYFTYGHGYPSPGKVPEVYSSSIPFHLFRSCRAALQSSWSVLIGPNFRVTDIVPPGVHEGSSDKVSQASDSDCNLTPEVHSGPKETLWQVIERVRNLGRLHLGILHSTAHHLYSWQDSIFSHSKSIACSYRSRNLLDIWVIWADRLFSRENNRSSCKLPF